MQSGFNVDLTAPLSTARWTHVAGVVDARQGFAALSMTTGVQLPASRHARLLFQASLCCGYYYHYYYYSSLSGSNPLTLSSSCRATRPRASQCVQPIISMQPLPSRLNPSTTGLQAALHQLPLQPTCRNCPVSCCPLSCTSLVGLLFLLHCAVFAVSDHAAASAAFSGTLAVSERLLGMQLHAATFM